MNARASHRPHSKPVYTLLLTLVLGLVEVGCTSFAFPGRDGAQAPPADLLDRGSMIEMPAGTFPMGWGRGEPDEFPIHQVELNAFLIDRYEVTNGEWMTCVSSGVCKKTKFSDDPVLGRGRHPVVGVTYRAASRYCDWLGKRLPTEAEWEYAARTPRNSIFPWEGRFQALFVNARGDADGYEKTAPVGSFPEGRTALGVHDMAGNVAEWTSDWYDATYYKDSPGQAPKGPDISTGSKSIRGGAWPDNDYLVRVTGRAALDPNVGQNSVGFRCVAEITASN